MTPGLLPADFGLAIGQEQEVARVGERNFRLIGGEEELTFDIEVKISDTITLGHQRIVRDLEHPLGLTLRNTIRTTTNPLHEFRLRIEDHTGHETRQEAEKNPIPVGARHKPLGVSTKMANHSGRNGSWEGGQDFGFHNSTGGTAATSNLNLSV